MTETPQERRQFPRHDVAFPIKILDRSGGILAKTQTVNLSESGAFFFVPADQAPERNSSVEIGLSAPGIDGNIEQFCCQAEVIRHEQGPAPDRIGVAVKFATPLPLKLEK